MEDFSYLIRELIHDSDQWKTRRDALMALKIRHNKIVFEMSRKIDALRDAGLISHIQHPALPDYPSPELVTLTRHRDTIRRLVETMEILMVMP